MGLALDNSFVLYTLQNCRDQRASSSNSTNEDAKPPPSALDLLEGLASDASSTTGFTTAAQKSSIHSLYVTSVDWRVTPSKEASHEYVVLHVSSSAQAPPTAAIRIDRYGKIGIRERWWQRPCTLTPNTIRTATMVLAGPIDDKIADPSTGSSIQKYMYWTHVLPLGVDIHHLKRTLENSRKDVCTALNHSVRPYIPNGLYLTKPRHGRRWANARGLELLHPDVADALAEAMDTGILRCLIQSFWVRILPSRVVWRSALRRVKLRQEYARAVDGYRTGLRRIIDGLPNLDSETRSKIQVAWGAEELTRPSPLVVQLLDKSLSKHAFISPGSPIATLSDVASRINTAIPLLPESGLATPMCRLYAKILSARLPDDLWHGYATPVPPEPVGVPRATWRRAKDSEIFWAFFDIFLQYIMCLALTRVDAISQAWVILIPICHAWILLPWRSKKRKFWKKMWTVYEGNLVQVEGESWDGDSDTFSLHSTKKSYGKWSADGLEVVGAGIELLHDH